MKQPWIACVAGKSGGHVLPALTLALQERAKNSSLNILFFATTSSLDRSLLEHEAIEKKIFLPAAGLPRRWWLMSLAMMKSVWSFVVAFFWLMRYRPQQIISTGGFVSLPVVCAAWCARIPCQLWELNVEPGAAVKALAPLARDIHYCFALTAQYLPKRAVQKKYPIRFQSFSPSAATSASSKKMLLILGGSQGSRALNTLVRGALLQHQEHAGALEIIHQTGQHEVTQIAAWYQEHGFSATVFAYRSDLHTYYQAAGLVIARAGAGTIFELLHYGKQSILIPLETVSTHHQVSNARAIADEHPHLFTVVLQKDVEKEQKLLSDMLMMHLIK